MCSHFPGYPNPVYNLPFFPVVYPLIAIHPIHTQPYTAYNHPAGLYRHSYDQVDKNPYASHSRQQYPEVDPTIFHQSAKSFDSLMDDGRTLLTKLNESESFAAEVMEAAQRNDKEKVKQLLESTGIEGTVTTQFNPDEITVTIYSDDEEINCRLSMSLQWR